MGSVRFQKKKKRRADSISTRDVHRNYIELFFQSQSRIQNFWQLSGFSLNDLIKSELIDSSFENEYDWLFDAPESESLTPQSKENLSPRADPQLVRLFKSVNDQGTTVTDPEIITYIREV